MDQWPCRMTEVCDEPSSYWSGSFGVCARQQERFDIRCAFKVNDWAASDRGLSIISALPRANLAGLRWPCSRRCFLQSGTTFRTSSLPKRSIKEVHFGGSADFFRWEPTPERTAFVRFRRIVVAQGPDKVLFDDITAQLKARAIKVEIGTLVDATIIASASEGDAEGNCVNRSDTSQYQRWTRRSGCASRQSG